MKESSFESRFPVYDMNGSKESAGKYLSERGRDELVEHGAVLLRNTGVVETDELEAVARGVIADPYEAYTGGTVPRTSRSKYVFTSTELNPLFYLKLHNEMAYQSNYPRFITFFCNSPSQWGGETPVAHESDILGGLDDALADKIRGTRIAYTRRYPSSRTRPRLTSMSSMFLSWQDAFHTEVKADVEDKCAGLDVKVSWDTKDTLELEAVLPAFRTLPENGREVFFNQILAQNYSLESLGPLGYYAHRVFGVTRDSAIRHSAFEDRDLTNAEITTLRRAGESAHVSFEWKPGDYMLLDNYQVQHSRKPFVGARSIWVVMGE